MQSQSVIVVNWLIDKGADLNLREKYFGDTPLITAFKYNLGDSIIKKLLDRNANPFNTNHKEKNAIYYAHKTGRNSMINYIKEIWLPSKEPKNISMEPALDNTKKYRNEFNYPKFILYILRQALLLYHAVF